MSDMSWKHKKRSPVERTKITTAANISSTLAVNLSVNILLKHFLFLTIFLSQKNHKELTVTYFTKRELYIRKSIKCGAVFE